MMWLAGMPVRWAKLYLRTLRSIRERRLAGLCVICGAPAEDGDLCLDHRLERMAGP